ncbi:hypothetical protein JCM18920_2498 [Cutibacterium acnes JCM 18920]|nr:hypothetical protein JCM18920_2498 [Cutibacterium acnes JCM 18920]
MPEWADEACQRWGFFGVASRHRDEIEGILLVAAETCLPPDHPMSKIPRTPGAAVLVAFFPIGVTLLGGECARPSWQLAYTDPCRSLRLVALLDRVPILVSHPSPGWNRGDSRRLTL